LKGFLIWPGYLFIVNSRAKQKRKIEIKKEVGTSCGSLFLFALVDKKVA